MRPTPGAVRRWVAVLGPATSPNPPADLGAAVVRQVPHLHRAVSSVISRAEELFFRGALYGAFAAQRPVLWSTVGYVAVTAAAGSAVLALAAAVMGTLLALERRSTRGILAPATTHVVWSTLMIFLLPR